MTREVSPLAGKPATPSMLIDVPKLIDAYYTLIPNPKVSKQRVLFGTSGHRGSSLNTTFNEWHILAIAQAICLFRKQHKIGGPLFIGIDTHALSKPALQSTLEVLTANHVVVMLSKDDEYTPTPAVSFAILAYNQNRTTGLADGIIITPSHNPPNYGGFKYNPPNGGPADFEITTWIEKKANELLENKLHEVKRISYEKAKGASTTHRYDYLTPYVEALGSVIDMEVIRSANIHLGVDPMGGAGVHYWEPISARYGLNLTVVNKVVDPTFRFMTVDWDGQIRMDPASKYAMINLIELKDRFDIAFACDTDHDRHGIVTRKVGLLPPNHYLSVAIFYLLQHRKKWTKSKAVGKTVVSSQMLDRVTKKLGHALYEVPVGFKWFTPGLLDGSLGFCGEQSAGAVFDRFDGSVWTTDKDGIILALLSAEITAALDRDIGEIYKDLENEFGKTFYERDDAKATPEQKAILKKMTPQQVTVSQLAGEKIETILTHAPGDNEPIGGLKVMSKSGWFVARPSGTEDIYEICAESFRDHAHLQCILDEAQKIVRNALQPKQENLKENL